MAPLESKKSRTGVHSFWIALLSHPLHCESLKAIKFRLSAGLGVHKIQQVLHIMTMYVVEPSRELKPNP